MTNRDCHSSHRAQGPSRPNMPNATGTGTNPGHGGAPEDNLAHAHAPTRWRWTLCRLRPQVDWSPVWRKSPPGSECWLTRSQGRVKSKKVEESSSGRGGNVIISLIFTTHSPNNFLNGKSSSCEHSFLQKKPAIIFF